MRETKLWTWHIITAAIILIFLSLHMLIMHLDLIMGVLSPAGGRAIDWENVISRSKMVFFVITYIVLLGAALYHGLYGLRNILFELSLKKGMQKFINIMLIFGGICLFAAGTYAAIAVKMM